MEPWSSRCSASYVLDGMMELALQREHCSLLAEERTCLTAAVWCRGEDISDGKGDRLEAESVPARLKG
eukprot:3408759-Rhodomonas_salina.1